MGCIIAVCMIVLGILLLVMPEGVGFAVNYTVAAGILFNGNIRAGGFFPDVAALS